jgi:EAL domain-containing protein (putative c-di-GMP-specific phosphodiesterase class I)/GGDEF domain-containing protein
MNHFFVKKKIERFFLLLVAVYLIINVILISSIYYFYSIIDKSVNKLIKDIKKYASLLSKGNFIRLDISKVPTFLKETMQYLDKVSKNYAHLANELNIAKDIIEQKELTDELTGIANKKAFERDIRGMFITAEDGYVAIGKAVNLGGYVEKFGTERANAFLRDIAVSITNYLNSKKLTKVKFYRLYGAEFAFIIKSIDIGIIRTIFKDLKEVLFRIEKSFEIKNPLVFGVVPFDPYGTGETITKDAKNALQKALQEGKISFVKDRTEFIKKNRALEDKVRNFVEDEKFDISFAYFIYPIDNPDKVTMKQATVVFDKTRQIPTVVFISVMERLKLITRFDKLLIEKVIEYFKENSVDFNIVVQFSLTSISRRGFLAWLEGRMVYMSEEERKKLIFAVSANEIKNKLEIFKNFCDFSKKFEVDILMKKYRPDIIDLNELQEIKFKYIKLDRTLCNDVATDLTKQHAVKNAILFANANDMMVIGENVMQKGDYEILKKLGVYAIGY